MDFHLRPEEEALRAEVRAFLDENLPPGANENDPKFHGMRALTKQLESELLGAETSINKLLRAELEVGFGELALELQGSAGHLAAEVDGGRWQSFALSWPEVVIGGGTPNIQKNIIAERVLGLPKD